MSAPGFTPLSRPATPFTVPPLQPFEPEVTHRPYDSSPFVNEYSRPLPSYQETFSGPGYYTAPVKTSGFSTASLICSLVGIALVVTLPLGVIFGHIGLHQTRHNMKLGHSAAVTGLVLGYALLTMWGLLSFSIWWVS